MRLMVAFLLSLALASTLHAQPPPGHHIPPQNLWGWENDPVEGWGPRFDVTSQEEVHPITQETILTLTFAKDDSSLYVFTWDWENECYVGDLGTLYCYAYPDLPWWDYFLYDDNGNIIEQGRLKSNYLAPLKSESLFSPSRSSPVAVGLGGVTAVARGVTTSRR